MDTIPQHGFYVYVLKRPNPAAASASPESTPFYVGKGKGQRMFAHVREALTPCRCHRCNVVRKIWREGGQVEYDIVYATDDEAEAFAVEQATIATFGRENLTNATDGGEGASGRVLPEASRARIAQTLQQYADDPAVRAKLSDQAKQMWQNDPTLAVRMREARQPIFASAEWRARMVEQTRASWEDPEIRKRRVQGIKGYWEGNEDRKAQVGATMQARWQDPAWREKMAQVSKTRVRSEEEKARRSASAKAAYADPEKRARMDTARKQRMSDPEVRRKISDAAKRRYQDLAQRQASSARLSAHYADPVNRQKASESAQQRAATSKGRQQLLSAQRASVVSRKTKQPPGQLSFAFDEDKNSDG